MDNIPRPFQCRRREAPLHEDLMCSWYSAAMKLWIQLDHKQKEVFAGFVSNIGQALMLFSLAAGFAPDVINLQPDFSKFIALIAFVLGIVLLAASVIIIKRKKI